MSPPPLGPEARELIGAADGTDLPGRHAKERVRERLAAAIGGSIVGTAAASAVAKSASTSATAMAKGAGGGLASALFTKILAGVIVAGAVTVGYVAGRRSEPEATRHERTATPVVATGPAVPPTVAPTATAAPLTAPEQAVAPEERSSAQHGAPRSPLPLAATAARAVPAHPSESAAAAPLPTAPAATVTTPEAEGEAALLQRARAAIDAGDGVTALDALDAHERRFPSGLLADQRAAERVVALCTIAKGAVARERAEHFLAERPRSQQANRIRRACGLP